MRRAATEPLVVNGWRVYAHSLFLDQLDALVEEVGTARAKDPAGYANKNAAKRMAAIAKLALDVIPQDPARPEYRLGGTLAVEHKNWLRAKFFQQYRLFFRYSSADKAIILAWVNDEGTKRAYRSRTDAYSVFRKMLNDGNPPEDWDELLREAKRNTARLHQRTNLTDN